MPHHLNLRVIIAQGLIFAFLLNSLGPLPAAQAQDMALPVPGTMVPLSPAFNPPILKGIKVHPDNPFRFDFILDRGDSQESSQALKEESSKLIKYFLASLTIPEKDLWVNLSPYEKNRIVPESFGQTEMGRDLLAEDYMLKQITASLIYPEGKTGKRFWKSIYQEASKRFGTTNIPVNTFNKVWIVPEKAVVYENAKAGTAYVVEAKLKVMLEQDYLALSKHQGQPTNALGSKIIREIVIPQLTKEVNEDKNFAQLRQVYNSLILATWYKKKIKDSILEQVYANKNKVAGVNIDDPREKERIYQRYLQAFKKGAYNYIKEEIDPVSQQSVPRKYFSGGELFTDLAMNSALHIEDVQNVRGLPESTGNYIVSADMTDAAMRKVEAGKVSTKDAAMKNTGEISQINEARTKEEIDKIISQWMKGKRHFNLRKVLIQERTEHTEDAVLLYAGQSNNPIGVLLAIGRRNPNGELFLWEIVVVEVAIKNQHLGQQLLQKFVDQFGERNAIKTYLISLTGGQHAWVKFHKNLGFFKIPPFGYLRLPSHVGRGDAAMTGMGVDGAMIAESSKNTIMRHLIKENLIARLEYSQEEIEKYLSDFNAEKITTPDHPAMGFINNLKAKVDLIAQVTAKRFFKTFSSETLEHLRMIYAMATENAIDSFLQKMDKMPATKDKLHIEFYIYRLEAGSQNNLGLAVVNNGIPFDLRETTEDKQRLRKELPLGQWRRTGGSGIAMSEYTVDAIKGLSVQGAKPDITLYDRRVVLDNEDGAVLNIGLKVENAARTGVGKDGAMNAENVLESVSSANSLKKDEILDLPFTGLNYEDIVRDSQRPDSIAYSIRSKEDNRLFGYIVAYPLDRETLYVMAASAKFNGIFPRLYMKITTEAKKRGFKNLKAVLRPEGIRSGVYRLLAPRGRVVEIKYMRTARFQHQIDSEVRAIQQEQDRKVMFTKLENLIKRYPISIMVIETPLYPSNNPAMMGNAKTGGIDLTSDKALSVQNNGQGIKFHLDSAQLQELQNAPGFVPVIISIQPLGDLRLFLGIQQDAKDSVTA